MEWCPVRGRSWWGTSGDAGVNNSVKFQERNAESVANIAPLQQSGLGGVHQVVQKRSYGVFG